MLTIHANWKSDKGNGKVEVEDLTEGELISGDFAVRISS
jgi:hypothetical protein